MKQLDIFDTKTAFESLTDADLHRTILLFRTLGIPALSHYGPTLAAMALKLKLPVRTLIQKTIFAQFCGGESIEECTPTMERLSYKNVGTILDYASEGFSSEDAFHRTESETLLNIEHAAKQPYIPFCVFKPTGIAPFDIMERVSIGANLDASQQDVLNRARERLNRICQRASELRVKVLIDAEESWIQPFVDAELERLMALHNRKEAIIHTTAQMYRTDRLQYLKSLYERATSQGFMVGVKLVRGAYLEKEVSRAKALGIESPVFQIKEDTDNSFNQALLFILDHHERFGICLGTHNEASTRLMAQKMDELGVHRSDPSCFFAQLLGMGDHLTFNLSSAGYLAAKYVPYGKIEEVIPYLGRRAQENSSIKGQTSRELDLLSREMQRRRKSRAS